MSWTINSRRPVRAGGRHRARSRVGSGWARASITAAVAGLILSSAVYSASAESRSAAAVPSLPAAAATAAAATAAAVNCVPISDPITTSPTAVLGAVFAGVRLNSLQLASASTIVRVGTNLHITRRGIRIALAVAMQESSLNPAATRGPYLGLFQQRIDPTTGLYKQYNRLDPAGSATMFFQQLARRVPRYETDPRLDWQVGEVVQQTNVGRNVEQWFGLSEAMTARLTVAPVIQLVAPATRSVKPAVTGVTGRNTRAGMAVPALRRSGGAFVAAPADLSLTSARVASARVASAGVASAGVASAPLGGDVLGVLTDPLDPPPNPDSASVGPSDNGADGSTSSAGSTTADTPTPGATGETTTPPTSASTTESSTASTTPESTQTPTPPTTLPSTTGPPSTPVVAATPTPPTTGPTTTPPTTGATATAPGAPSTPTAPVTSTRVNFPPVPGVPTVSTVTTGPVATTPVTLPRATVPVPVQTTPPNVSVNPDPPEPPVPTNSADPSVGSDPTAAAPTASSGRSNGNQPSAAQTGTAADCAPSPGGRSTAFDPGMIISDAVFYNSASMSAANIRTFINAKGVNCTAAACLRLLRVSTPSKPADRYCAAYQGGTNEDVAAVLKRLSVACRINPQVMLVTLQKESALLTRTDVTARSYDAMYGWHCPDSGPGGSANCDPQYAGFFNQTYGMAKQWARYRVDPQNYNFQAGRTHTILWNVASTGCGGSSVFIRNTATASLYDYTPYQPNAASLAAYPGVGDRCSSYGNRNFFFMFQKYFGTTGGGVDQNVGLNGVRVTLPSGPHVAPGAAGAVITAPTAAMARGLAAGLAAVGVPYVYGGGTAGGPADQGCARAGGALNSCQGIVGFDCSGLTAYVLMQAGVQIPTYSGAQRAAGRGVPWSQGKPGDIIGYQGHVAIYLGIINGTPYLLEAPDVGMYVQVRPVYYSNHGIAVDSSLHRYWG